MGDGLPMVSEAIVRPAPSAASASMQSHGDRPRAGHRALHVAQASWLLQVPGEVEVSRHQEDVDSEAMMDTITEALVLAPFAGVLGGMLWVLYDHYSGFAGAECDMGDCHRWGRRDFTCFKCGKLAIYFCCGCSRMIFAELREFGRMTIVCIQCSKKEAL